jgi:hypothetical protein
MKLKLPIFIFILFCIAILCPSCSKVYFSTKNNTAWKELNNNISANEVTINDWLTYIVTSSFDSQKEPISLADHADIISSKLPLDLTQEWNNYVFNAFLDKKDDVITQKFYNHCNGEYIKINVSASAWDSIVKHRLLSIPIVGISYEQALAYLQYKEQILNNCDPKNKSGKVTLKYECFLPDPESIDTIVMRVDSITKDGCALFNYKNSFCPDCPYSKLVVKHKVISKIGKGPIYTTTYFPDKFGYYSLKGNVAEMTSIKGIAKGGSYAHYASESTLKNNQIYTKPEPWLGFRVWYKVYTLKEVRE